MNDRAKGYREGVLVWYGPKPDPAHWVEHWRRAASPEALARAASWHLADDELGRILLRWLPRAGRVLEAGCGAGQYVAALAAHGYDVVGVDSAAPLVELVRAAAPHLDVRVDDVLALDLGEDSVDAYVSIGVIEHRIEGAAPFLAEAARVVRPGGIAVVAAPAEGIVRRSKGRLGAYRSRGEGLDFYQYGYRAASLADLTASAGFDVVEQTFVGSHRLLQEELPAYRWLARRRGGHLLRRAAEATLGRVDGHMAVVVGRRRRA